MATKSLTSEIIKVKRARLSFPRLWVPKAFQEGQTPRYEATFLLDPSNEAQAAIISEIRNAAQKLVAAKWGEKPAGLKLCYGLADNDEVKKKYDGYAGMFYLVTANTTKPSVVGRTKEADGKFRELKDNEKGAPYAGCYVNTNVSLWTQDNKFGKGIRCNLRVVQFVEDGKAFSGAAPVNPDDEIEALEDSKKGAAAVASKDFDDL